MYRALELARIAGKHGDVPVGAVVIGPDDRVVGEGFNQRQMLGHPFAHAELEAMSQAASVAAGVSLLSESWSGPADHERTGGRSCAAERFGSHGERSWNLQGCTLVVTLEPCPMCAGAVLACHIGRVVFGSWDQKVGACGSVWDLLRDPHVGARPEVFGGVEERACTEQLQSFFRSLR